ncbi:MAG TPA: hypothetical protein ENH59_10860 [Bacteroidetes bacterium]|nr:hypothetical protein [Bacteroidota bacterium]
MKGLTSIHGVEKSIAGDLWHIGIKKVDDLKGRDPVELYDLSNRFAGKKQDRCHLYVFRMLDRPPFQMKKKAGTVMVTSGNMSGRGAGWELHIASHTLNITIGSIVDRPVNIDGTPESREHLYLTVSPDHDIVDGAPAALFPRHLKKMPESGETR